MVNETCTCGARLPDDARFCHKCGKPQFEFDIEPEVVTTPPVLATPAPIEPPKIPEVGWRNPAAVRVAVLAGSAISLLLIIPMPPVIAILRQFILPVAGAFWSIHLYRKRTGETVNARAGARLGWITGVFCFLIMTVVFTVTVIGLASTGALQETLREAATAGGAVAGSEQVQTLLASPAGIGLVFFGYLVFSFFMFTILASIGGALGAKVLDKD